MITNQEMEFIFVLWDIWCPFIWYLQISNILLSFFKNHYQYLGISELPFNHCFQRLRVVHLGSLSFTLSSWPSCSDLKWEDTSVLQFLRQFWWTSKFVSNLRAQFKQIYKQLSWQLSTRLEQSRTIFLFSLICRQYTTRVCQQKIWAAMTTMMMM